MKPSWTLRQLLAILRGIALMVALLWALILVQAVPAFVRGGMAGVRDHIEGVAIAGVPPARWSIAITHMYEALGATLLFGFTLFLAQRYLGRKLASSHPSTRPGMTYSNSSPS